MSALSKPQFTAEQVQKMQAKFTQFRILVIGRANAGKTTILRRLCNTTEEPMIFGPDGKKIESSESVLNPSLKRGKHVIENQMIFEGNPGFVFHDSRGFEAGDAEELNLVLGFIEQRSKSRDVNEQLHAIWYCIPTSDDRPITAAEKKFFNECGTGLVPVIILWTKTDSLDDDKIIQLMNDEGISLAEAKKQAPQKAWAEYEKNTYQHFARFKYPPKAYVVFRNMHKPGADCDDLIKKTTAALSSEDLQQLFLSTQQNSVKLCIRYGVHRIVNSPESVMLEYFKQGSWAKFMEIVLAYFPQFNITGAGLLGLLLVGDISSLLSYEHHHLDSISKILSSILSGLSPRFNLQDATYCAIVAAIIGHLSFFLHQESSNRRNSLERATEIYHQSNHDTSVKQAVENLFKGSHVKDAILNLFKLSHIDLPTEAIQIAMDNLLSFTPTTTKHQVTQTKEETTFVKEDNSDEAF